MRPIVFFFLFFVFALIGVNSFKFNEIQLFCFLSSLFGFIIIYFLIELDIYSGKFDIFNPKYYFLIGFAVFIFVGMFKSAFSINNPLNNIEETIFIISLCFGGLFAFLIPHFRTSCKVTSIFNLNYIDANRLIKVTIVYSILSSIILHFTDPRPEYANVVGYVGYMNGAASIFAGYLLFIKKIKKNLTMKLILFVIFLMGLFISKSRTPMAYIISSLLLLHFWTKKIKSLSRGERYYRFPSIIFFIIPLMLLLAGIYKASNLITNLSDLKNLENIKIVYNYSLVHGFKFEFVDAFDNFVRLKQLFYDNGILLWGETIYALFVNVIPRFLWSNKPMSLGYILPQQFFAVDEPSTSLATSLLGELLVNFSVVGLLLGHFFFGCISIWLYKKFKTNFYSEEFVLPYVILLFLFFLESRGDFLTVNIRGLSYALFIWIGIKYSIRHRTMQRNTKYSL